MGSRAFGTRLLPLVLAVVVALALPAAMPAGIPRAQATPCASYYADWTITGNVTWTTALSPVCLSRDMTVDAGATLTIEPGVVVKFTDRSWLNVYGTLRALGTSANKIYFTSFKDDTVGGDTNGDGGATLPARADWQGMSFYGGSYLRGIGDLAWIEVRYAGNTTSGPTVLGNIYVSESDAFLITNSVLRDSGYAGLYISNSASARFDNNTFSNNAGPAVMVVGGALPTLGYRGNTGTGNRINGIVLDHKTVVGNATWTANPSFPYVIRSVEVTRSASLTLDPGVVVKLVDDTDPPGFLAVYGTLVARGTSSNKIYFTSINDDTVGGDTGNDGNEWGPFSGDWAELFFSGYDLDQGIGDLDWVEVRYGGRQPFASIRASRADSFSMTNSMVVESLNWGAYINPDGPVSITNSLFARNRLEALKVRSMNRPVTIHSSTLVANGGGIDLDAGNGVEVRNTLITNNPRYPGVKVEVSGAAPVFENNDVWGNETNYAGWPDQTGTNGNISADPLFVNPAAGDYHIRNESPAIDAGTATGAPATDIDGQGRPQGVFYDMGFDEAPSVADLSISKTDAPDPVLPGGALTYTLTVRNTGPRFAAGIVLTDVVPANTTFQSLSAPAGWSCSTPPAGGTGTVRCSTNSLANLSVSLRLAVRVSPVTPVGTTIQNRATVSSSTLDPDPSNNTATATTRVGSANLSITKLDTPDPVSPGGILTYTIGVRNSGPSSATSLTLRDTLPVSTAFRSLSAPWDWSCTTPPPGGTGEVRCTASKLSSGDTRTFTLTVAVGTKTPLGATITNRATILSRVYDPNSTNNSATAKTSVASPSGADLSLKKTDGPDPVAPGGVLTYTIYLSNKGPGPASNLVLTETVPANTTFRSVSAPVGWTCTSPPVGGTGVVRCTTPGLSASVGRTFRVTVAVNPGTPAGTVITNQATVSSATADPVPVNNITTTTTMVGTGAAPGPVSPEPAGPAPGDEDALDVPDLEHDPPELVPS